MRYGAVVVHLAVDQKKLADEPVDEAGVRHVRLGVRVQKAVVGLGPGGVVEAVVVVSRLGHADLVHFRELQHRPGRGEAAAGVAEHADPVEVHPLRTAQLQLLLRQKTGGAPGWVARARDQ